MTIDRQTQEELRALVASEVQDALRKEMTQWWAESVVALSAERTRPMAGSSVSRQVVRPRKVGSAKQSEPTGEGGPTESGAAAARPSTVALQPEKATQAVSPRAELLDTDYMGLVANSLARTQLELSRELALSMQQLQELLSQAQKVAERLEAMSKG